MAEISMKTGVSQILAVLRETFDGPQEGWSYFTDSRPEAGYFGTLKKVTASEASLTSAGTSVASHIHHVVFALNEASGWIRGDHTPRNWKESWSVQTVNEAEWAALLDELRRSYSDLLNAIEESATTSVEAMGGAVGAVAHSAFHLGAIRQKVTQLLR